MNYEQCKNVKIQDGYQNICVLKHLIFSLLSLLVVANGTKLTPKPIGKVNTVRLIYNKFYFGW
jgi:hypothetical protein